jgi:hypothetical protein
LPVRRRDKKVAIPAGKRVVIQEHVPARDVQITRIPR